MTEHDKSKEIARKKEELSSNDRQVIDDINKLPLPDEKKNELIATMEMYSGPIPHPTILAGYKALYPDAAKKIIDNGIEESKHRRRLEESRQRRRGHLAWVALIAVIIISLVFVAGSFWLIMLGHLVTGSIFAGVSFISFLSIMYSGVLELSDNDDRTANHERKQDN